MPSITLLTVAYIGGIASISGAVMAGVIAVGGLVYVFVLKEIGDLGNYYILVSGIGLIWTVIAHPDGVAPFFGERITKGVKRLVGRPVELPAEPSPPAAAAVESAPEPARVP